jgi:hypothetical protein
MRHSVSVDTASPGHPRRLPTTRLYGSPASPAGNCRAHAACPSTNRLGGVDSSGRLPLTLRNRTGCYASRPGVLCPRTRSARTRRSGSMGLREKVAKQLPLRRKHAGRIMEDYAFLCIYVSRRNALNSADPGVG